MVAREIAPRVMPRPMIAASWARSARSNRTREDLEVASSMFDGDSPLARSAQSVIDGLCEWIGEEPIGTLLCDARGVVVLRRGADRMILRDLDSVALAPGSDYSEASVGTNGLGLTLVEDRSVLVTGTEHYNHRLSRYQCSGAPVHDPVTGRQVGAVSLTTWSARRNELLVALAAQTALLIEARLAREWFELVHGAPIASLERRTIELAMHQSGGSAAEAAAVLGLSRATIYRKIRQYRVQGEGFNGRD